MRILSELGRGIGLIIRDIHRFFYRRIGARIWWIYIFAAWLPVLWLTGRLWDVVFSILTIALMVVGLWLIIRSAFRRGGQRRDRERR